MWSSIAGGTGVGDVPGARHKHGVCSSYPYVYLLGGRQGNTPLKDFWIYDLTTRTWRQECEDKGPRPPSLQQHSMVCSQGKIFVFGGELCMSNETPLWIYEIQRRQWRKWQHPISDEGGGSATGLGPRPRSGGLKRDRAGCAAPDARRGHSAIVVDNQMIIYGGYRDLRGSTGEIWSFNIKDESWRQIPTRGDQPPPRHAHTAVVHDNQMWVYGGMTDLVERSDFWKYDITLRQWTHIRTKPNPGLLHSHVAVKLHSFMVIFGGERQGLVLNDLWRYHFATGLWEKLLPSGSKPQPRTQCCAFVGPSHSNKQFRFASGYSSLGGASSSSGSSSSSSGYGSTKGNDLYRMRKRHADFTAGRGFNEPSNFGSDTRAIQSKFDSLAHIEDSKRICGCRDCVERSDDEENGNDIDDIDPRRLKSLIQRNCANSQLPPNLAKLPISKISHLNLSHLGKYYSYSVLSNDSTESIVEESLSSTCDSVVSKLARSQSIHGINEDCDSRTGLPRDILSVPNFADIDNKSNDELNKIVPMDNIRLIKVVPSECDLEASLDDEQADLYMGLKGRLALSGYENAISTDTSISENLMSFSCTESSLSSVCNGSIGLGSFTNPNYVGINPDKTGGLLSQDYWTRWALDLESVRHKEFADLLKTPPDSGIGSAVEMERRTPVDVSVTALEDFLSMDDKIMRYKKPKDNIAVCSPGIDEPTPNDKRKSPSATGTFRVTFSTDPVQTDEESASSGNRNGTSQKKAMKGRANPFLKNEPVPEPEGPEAMYVLGGKETGQLAVFKRPISIWKLDLQY